MFKFIVLISSAFVVVQCQIFAPYQRSCSSGLPAIQAIVAANQPCGNPVPLPFPMPAVLPKGPVLAAPCEMPVALPVPAPVPKLVASPPCGCLDAAFPPLPLSELPLPNPFLPAASPISALAPFSPLLPPACPCSRCQYLKKIPIPPPCI